MSAYQWRVASVQWIDVYASDAQEAEFLANKIYVESSEDERNAIPSFVLAWDVHCAEDIDIENATGMALEAQFDKFEPMTDPF